MALDILERQMTRELLRYGVMRQIFCPECERVLDTDKAVLVTPKESKRGATYCACVECHDKAVARLSAVDHAAFAARHDVYDGRELT